MLSRIISLKVQQTILVLVLSVMPFIQDSAYSKEYSVDYRHSIWSVMQKQYRLLPNNQPHTRKHISTLLHNQAWVMTLTKRSEMYMYYLFQQTQIRHMPAEVALIPMLESHFNPREHSPTGASGLWQLQPALARALHIPMNRHYDGRYDVLVATKAALKHLEYLHQRFGDWLLAFAAYNCGEGRLAHAIAENRRQHKATDFWHLNLPEETKHYVPGLLALATLLANPRKYHLKIYNVANHPYFSAIAISQQQSLTVIAKNRHVPATVMSKLNSGYQDGLVSPRWQKHALVPIS